MCTPKATFAVMTYRPNYFFVLLKYDFSAPVQEVFDVESSCGKKLNGSMLLSEKFDELFFI